MSAAVQYYLRGVWLTEEGGVKIKASAHHALRRRWEGMIETIDAMAHCAVGGDVAAFGLAAAHDLQVLATTLRHVANSQLKNLRRLQGLAPMRLKVYDPEPPQRLAGADRRLRRWLEATGMPAHKVLDDGMTIGGLSDVVSLHHDLDLSSLTRDEPFAVVSIDTQFDTVTRPLLRRLVEARLLSDGAVILFGEAWTPPPGCGGYRAAWLDVAREAGIKWEDWGPFGLAGRRILVHTR